MKPLLRLVPYLKRYRTTLLWGLFAVVMSNAFTVALPLFVGSAVDELKKGLTSGSVVQTDLLRYAVLVVVFSLISGVFSFVTRQTIIVVSRHIEYDLRNDFLVHIQKLPLSYYQNTPTGDLMALATNDIGAVRNAVGPGIMYPVDTVMTFIMVLGIMMATDYRLTLLALIPLPLVSYVVYRLGKLVHAKFEERQEQYSRLTTRAQENLSGIRVIKTYVREAHETELFRAMSWEYLKKNLVLARVQSIMWPMMFLLVGFSIVITLFGGGQKVIDGQMSIGTLTAFFVYLTMLIWPMIAFGWVINILQQGAASMSRLGKMFDVVPEIQDSEATDHSISSLKGDIEFRDVRFRHKSAARDALDGVSFRVKAGQTLAIVGYTGTGKTTLVNLLPRLYDVTGGSVMVDGIDVRKIPLEVLRGAIGCVPQETFLFSDRLRENIAYGADGASLDEVAAAADISQISRDVEDFPAGYDTMLGERGITLSGGQKQRTSIARALVRKPAILILDDALSAVDTETEERILKKLRAFMKGRTSILISHRISTVKEADRIIVLNKGRIAEEGTHESLVALGGIYAELHRKQLLEEALEKL